MGIQFITAYFMLAGSVVLTLMVLLGWGRMIREWLGVQKESQIGAADAWVGLCALIGLSEIINFVLPIDWKISLASYAVGLALLYKHKANCKRSILTIKLYAEENSLWLVFIAILVVFWVAQGMLMPGHPDSGLYHFQTVRWINEYKAILGIGNLHTRLAYNQSWFFTPALLNFYPFWNKGYAISGLLLILLPTITLLEVRLEKLRMGWVLTALIILGVQRALWQNSSSAPDLAVVAFEYAIFLMLIRTVYILSLAQPRRAETFDLIIMCCTLLTIKLSAVAFAISSIAIVVYANESVIVLEKRFSYRLLFLCATIILVHLVRGYILSGFPLFPSAIGALTNFDWAVLPEAAKVESQTIIKWAQHPGVSYTLVPDNWDWFNDWLARVREEKGVFLALVSVLFLLALVIPRLALHGKIKRDAMLQTYMGLYAICAISIVFWFLTAPDLRFLGAVLWLLASLTAWIVVLQVGELGLIDSIKYGKVIKHMCLTGAFVMSVPYLLHAPPNGWAKLPAYVGEDMATDSGLQLHVSRVGMCWDSPLPCVPDLNRQLRSRDDVEQFNPDLGKGFTVK